MVRTVLAGLPLSLRLLVLRCQAGDEGAFAKLMDAFGSRTLRYLRAVVGDDADDVQQEVWLTVYRRLHDLADPGAFRSWLFRTTRHRAIDRLRQRKREREWLDAVPVDELVNDLAIHDDVLEPSMDEQTLDSALMALPPHQREVIALKYRDDLSYEEIAVIVGAPIGTVRTRLFHAKRKLHDILQRQTP
jgi:RNA polymerase sigma-70 factor (ECF subfamily)